MKISIFTLGAEELRIEQMEKFADAIGFAGKYVDVGKLMEDAKKKKFDYVLVFDKEALEDKVDELKELGIEVVEFKDKKRLEKLVLNI